MIEETRGVDIDNASHRVPAYFEWFYCHFVDDDGTALNMVVHETDIFGLEHTPYLSLSVRLPGQKPCYLRRDLAGVPIAGEGPFLQVGAGMIAESARTMTFDVAFPGRGHFRGEIVKLAPPLAFQDGVLYTELESGRSSHWVVQIPHATFSGILQFDGRAHPLRGTAYQDHQWGTLPIQAFVSDWVWGHFAGAETAVLFFQILTQRGQRIERVALLTAEGRFAGTAVETGHLDALFQTERPQLFEESVAVTFLNRQVQLAFDLAPANLMRRRLEEAHERTVAGYLRWAAAATLRAGCGPQSLHGISEYIRIRPATYGGFSEPTHH